MGLNEYLKLKKIIYFLQKWTKTGGQNFDSRLFSCPGTKITKSHFSGRKCWTFELFKLYHLVLCQIEAKTKYFPLKMKRFIHGLFRN